MALNSAPCFDRALEVVSVMADIFDKYPCLVCAKDKGGTTKVKRVICVACRMWCHTSCANLGGVKEENCSAINWVCNKCVSEIKLGTNRSLSIEFEHLKKEVQELKDLLRREFTLLRKERDSSELTECVSEVRQVVDALSGQSESAGSWVDVVKRKKKRECKNLLVIKSNEDGGKAVAMKKEVAKVLSDVQIKDSKFTQGGNIIMNFVNEAERNEAADKLKVIDTVNTKNVKKLMPKVMVCNVHKEEDIDDLIDTLIERNLFLQSIDNTKDKMKLVFDKPAAGGTVHYIIKCDPQVRELIYRNGDQLKLRWGIYGVRDRYHALLCYHCLRFGHVRSDCPAKQKGDAPICYKCAGNHEGKNCTETTKKCVNCDKTNKQEIDHWATHYLCPIFAAELLRIKENTDHGYSN